MAEPTVSSLITLTVGGVLWLIMFIIVLKNEFKNPKMKKIWIIALLVFPPSALLFPFIGMNQTK